MADRRKQFPREACGRALRTQSQCLLDRKALLSDQGFEGGALAKLPSYPCQIPMPFLGHSEPSLLAFLPLSTPETMVSIGEAERNTQG